VTAVPAPTAEQQTAAIQDTLNKEAAKPPVQPAPVEAAPVEAPAVTKAKAMAAEATPPPSPESLAEADAIAKNDAPTEEIAKSVPSYTSPKKSGRASVPGQRSVYYNTGDANLDGIVHDSIIAHKGTADTAEARATALDKAGITQAQRAQIRNIAVNAVDKTTGRISAEGKQAIEDVITGRGAEKTAPVTTEPPVAEAPAGETVDTTPVDEALTSNPNKLGTITHNAVLDGSINTPEGVTKAINDVTTAAHNAAEESGAPLSDIIKKGQAAWEHSSARGKDLTPVEAQHGYNDRKGGYAGDPSFTPEQQQVYKDYAQEISTLRDRSGHSLTGGHQGAWYGPRQSLVDGKSAEFNPELINEISRKGQSSRTPVDSLDTSATPYEHAIQRYANAPDAGAQRIVNAIEKDPVTGAPNGVHLPDTAKQQLEDSLKAITEKRDQAARLEHEGNHDEAKQIRDSIVGDINNTFNKVIDDIPGTGSTRRAAINNVKAIREPYRQSMMQVLSLSNVVNRVADQGGKLVALAKRPLERGLEKVVGGHYANIARDAGTDVNTLNTNKEALTAARSIAKGSQGRQIIENAKTAQAMAGAGRGVVGKAAAKVAEIPSTLNAAATQLGDLHNMNVVDALKVGASLPGAKNLKTVADYQKYFGDWMKTDGYKQALSGAEHDNNRQIGMSGGKGDNMQSGGKASRIISKYLDNGVKTAAEHYGFNPENPLIRNANDYVKGNVTGYAGVGSRILGYGKDALTLGKLREAGKVAASGSPDAVARATQIASKQIASTIATYGTAGAAALAAKSGVIGYTGPQPAAGSSDSAYNKSYTVPANQWYINLPNGQRAYFNATRTFNTPGLAADVVGTAMTSKDPASATGAIAGQVYNQAGGSSLPQTIVNATDFAKDPTGQTPAGKYASEQLQQTAAPSTGILNNIANWQDPTKRAPTNFVDDLKSNLPVLRSQVPAAKDSQGNDIANSKQLSGGSSVLSIGTNPDASAAQGADPVATEINRLQKISGNVFPTSTNKNAKSDTSTYASMLLKDPIYTSLDDSGKAEMLKSILAGTSTKGIDPSLSSTDKQALMDASLLGSAKTQAWLDNNDNNSNYKTALYNNAQASKTLTADDNNMNHKTGLKYQMVRAQTDQKLGADSDLKQLYHDTSTTDMKNMLNPENENYNPDQAAKVYAYDQALASAHVSEASNTDSTKYNMAAILKSIAKANGPKGGKKTFGFANLPSTLVGTGSGGTGSGNGGYAADAPLFTPIASLKTPAIAAIPNGRTISVQKGEHL
jgi:archaellum component FlaC